MYQNWLEGTFTGHLGKNYGFWCRFSLQIHGSMEYGRHCLEQTPAVHIDGLEHRVFWDEPPELAKVLEENYEDVRWGADRLFGAVKGTGLWDQTTSPGERAF